MIVWLMWMFGVVGLRLSLMCSGVFVVVLCVSFCVNFFLISSLLMLCFVMVSVCWILLVIGKMGLELGLVFIGVRKNVVKIGIFL